MTHDRDILVSPCVEPGRRIPLARISVDDATDPDEEVLSDEEIHVTLIQRGPGGETPGGCFRLSTTSARELIAQLEAAIRRRQDPDD